MGLFKKETKKLGENIQVPEVPMIFQSGVARYGHSLHTTRDQVSNLFQDFTKIYDELQGANEGLEAALAEAREERLVLDDMIKMLEEELEMNRALESNLEQFIKPTVKQQPKGPKPEDGQTEAVG